MDRNHQPEHFSALEDRLRSIATRDVSDVAMEQYDDTIDGLVAAQNDEPDSKAAIIERQPAVQGAPRSWVWKSAAAITLGAVSWFAGFWNSGENGPTDVAFNNSDAPASETTMGSEFTLLKSVNRVDGHESDGLIIPIDGSIPHYRHRYHIVDEEQMRDEQSGAIVTIRQPREEVITVPVTNF